MIYEIIDIAIANDASDIHLTIGIQPKIRIDGKLNNIDIFAINTREKLNQVKDTLLTEDEIKRFEKDKFIDLSISYKDKRLRIHVFKQKGNDAFSIRLIPITIPKLEELNLPSILNRFTELRNGLVLVTGITGSGKSTTLAAMIDQINKNQEKHIITVEDPIEYIHQHKKSIVNQREIGQDVHNFNDAVSSAMREDPDILLLGELRNLETITSAVTMAETGHLVFATLHTKSVPETVDRVIDVFPGAQQRQIRTQFANSIQGIVSQELLPMIGGGRIPCCEIMVTNDAIRNLIREQANPSAITDQIHMTSRRLGSKTRTQSLVELVLDDKITIETASQGLSQLEIEDLNRLIKQKLKKVIE